MLLLSFYNITTTAVAVVFAFLRGTAIIVAVFLSGFVFCEVAIVFTIFVTKN